MRRLSIATPSSPSSNLDLGTLRIFVAIVETGSFVSGGKSLGLTRSAAGKAMARLEAHLGTRLLHRTTRTVSLTVDGERFYQRCVQILQDLEEAEADIRQDLPQPTGTLRISVTEAYGRIVVLPFLKRFLETWSELDVEVNLTDRIVDLVEEGFDLSIRIGDIPTNSQLIARNVEYARPYLYAAPSYINSFGSLTEPSDLGNHQRLIYGLGIHSTGWNLVTSSGSEVFIDGGRKLRFDSGEAIRESALHGMGVAYLPSFLVNDDVESGRLVRLLPNYGGKRLPIQVVYVSRNHLAQKIRLFIDGLVKHRQESCP
ncbi:MULTISPECIES: LysR family transcriptional regulator [unclassified Marinobacter]|uniref:LysR family transcriptional regulator n=1 Tax=unclassified Marinobacter TaxID=83889 RepID=UPI0019293D61|nr:MULTISPECIES: LysR family transcriptional regulator [unclassified Marinobacter]MBL3827120.1 LysR family transcriptional regulator [Marinobacter sp. MC3]MBL3895655.1 LysR family transcriptional regulator [Marinobacter sp. MW3]